MKTLFRDFNIVNGGNIVPHGDILVEDGRIKGTGSIPASEDMMVVEGRGRYLLPGFIDIHVHGGAGFDFMDGSAGEYNAIAKHHAAHGTTGLYATTLSASHEELLASVRAFDEAEKMKGGARLLGIHLEGPYIAKSQKGAMDERYIRDPEPKEYAELLSVSDRIKRMTIAPELPGAAELGRYLCERGVLPSIGHTDCFAEDVCRDHSRRHPSAARAAQADIQDQGTVPHRAHHRRHARIRDAYGHHGAARESEKRPPRVA